jgi:phage shock protein A
MTALLHRLKLLMKIWLDALFSPAEDPREVFALAQRRQRDLLDNVRRALATVKASREQLVRNSEEAQGRLPQLEERARHALVIGREDQARFALQLRQVVVEENSDIAAQILQMEEEERSLSLVEHRLASQIEAFFARQEVLAARYTSAEAQVRIREALGGVSEDLTGLDSALERAEETTENMQARVSAIDQLVETGIIEMPALRPDVVVQPQLNAGQFDGDVEEMLASLKQEVQHD